MTSRLLQWHEQLQNQTAGTQNGRELVKIDIEWIAAHSPQDIGLIERLCGTLQDGQVKEQRLGEIATLEASNRFLEIKFWRVWKQRFVASRLGPRFLGLTSLTRKVLKVAWIQTGVIRWDARSL